jgi:hypothetical protein
MYRAVEGTRVGDLARRIREVTIEDLLRREPVQLDLDTLPDQPAHEFSDMVIVAGWPPVRPTHLELPKRCRVHFLLYRRLMTDYR